MTDSEKKLRSRIETLTGAHKSALAIVSEARARVEAERDDRTPATLLEGSNEVLATPTPQYRIDTAKAALERAQRRAEQAAAELATASQLLVKVQANSEIIAAYEARAGDALKLDAELTSAVIEAFARIERQRTALTALHSDALKKWTEVPHGIREVVERPTLDWALSESETIVDRVAKLRSLRAVATS